MNPELSMCDPMQDPYNRERALAFRHGELLALAKALKVAIDTGRLPTKDGVCYATLCKVLEETNGRND